MRWRLFYFFGLRHIQNSRGQHAVVIAMVRNVCVGPAPGDRLTVPLLFPRVPALMISALLPITWLVDRAEDQLAQKLR